MMNTEWLCGIEGNEKADPAVKSEHHGMPGRCETSTLFCIENIHENWKDGLLKEINMT